MLVLGQALHRFDPLRQVSNISMGQLFYIMGHIQKLSAGCSQWIDMISLGKTRGERNMSAKKKGYT